MLAAKPEDGSPKGSLGIECATEWLNSNEGKPLLSKLSEFDDVLKKEMDKANFWTGGRFVVEEACCTSISPAGLNLLLGVNIRGKLQEREVKVAFPFPVESEETLKYALVRMAADSGRIEDTGPILELPFGESFEVPTNLLFNNVPHPAWVRAYIYDQAGEALKAVVLDRDKGSSVTPHDRAHLQVRVNFPEVNPAFDTYRIGTILEMVRAMTLACAYGGLRVRVCVQQSLGSGIFTGLPLAIASMRPILERMDWGLRPGEAPKRPNEEGYGQETSEMLVRFGTVGADVLAQDDDVVIVIAPQNVVGGSIVEPLQEMVRRAEAEEKTLCLVNPNLVDRPSSNNQMQIRGRKERREFQDSFKDMFVLRLLYPSSGGYMYPIRGMLAKYRYDQPYILYDHIECNDDGDNEFRILTGFPPKPTPDPSLISRQYDRKRRTRARMYD
jgi:hypothetical protein